MEEIFWPAIAAAATVFILGATSPGPSLAVVLRNTFDGGRKQGVACALGHGLGFGIYAFAAVFGLIFILETSEQLYNILQIIGGILLVWFGYEIWKKPAMSEDEKHDSDEGNQRKGFAEGFLIAFFNPKIGIFLLSVLSQILQPDFTSATKIAIAVLGMTIDGVWYTIVVLFLTQGPILGILKRNSKIIDRITALVLWGFAALLAYELIL